MKCVCGLFVQSCDSASEVYATIKFFDVAVLVRPFRHMLM